MDNIKRAFFGFMVFALVFGSFGVFNIPTAYAASLSDGDLIKASGAAVYYYDADEEERWVFPNSKTYATWYGDDFSSVKTVSDSELAGIPIGGNVVYRPGTRWIKITTDPKVYAVEPDGMLRWVSSEEIAKALHGANWNTTIDDVPDAFFAGNYEVGVKLESGEHPVQSLVSYSGDDNNYIVVENESGDLVKRQIASGEAFSANWFMDKYVYSTSVAYEDGEDVTGAEADFIDPTFAGMVSDGGDGDVSGGGLKVKLSSKNPDGQTIVTDTGGSSDGAQAFINFMALDLTASDGDVEISNMKFKRTGVSSDSDLSNMYLVEDGEILAEMKSFSSKVVEFNTDIEIDDGDTRTIWLQGDLANTTAAGGKTIGFDLVSGDDVTTDGDDVSGDFPMNGELSTTAGVADLGKFDIAQNTDTAPTSLDPGPDTQELWRFDVDPQEQNIEIRRMGFTMVGTIKPADIEDLYLEVDGQPITDVTQIDDDNTLSFTDFMDEPWKLTEGANKTVLLKGTVVGGSGRTVRWSIREEGEIMAYDSEYGVYLKVNQSDSMTLVESGSASTTINNGTLTISKSADSPTGGLALSATNQILAKFDVKAYGEDMKVDTFNIRVQTVDVTAGEEDQGFNNGKLLLDGTQIGVTKDLYSDETEEATTTCDSEVIGAGSNDDTCFSSFGNSVIIPAGETKVLTVKADITQYDATAWESGTTVQIHLNSGGDVSAVNVTAQSSLQTSASNAVSANQMTITSGNITVAKNIGVADGNTNNATAVLGATATKISSFTITASSAEAASVTGITLIDDVDTTSDDVTLDDYFQNLKLMHGTTQLGTTKGSLTDTDSTTYAFSLTPAVELKASEQYVVDVYADVKTGSTVSHVNTDDTDGEVAVSSVTATGKTTSTTISYTAASASVDIQLQNMFLASAGTLTIAADSSSPVAGQLVMGDSDQTLGVFRLTAGTSEDIKVKTLVMAMNSWEPGAWSNVKLYNSSGTQLGSTISSLNKVHAGTVAEAISATTFCLNDDDTGAATVDSAYVGAVIRLLNGTGEGQARVITAHDDDSATCTDTGDALITVASVTQPTNATTYEIGGQAVFELGDALVVPKGDDKLVTVKGTISAYPNAISGIAHIATIPNTVSAAIANRSEIRGVSSNTDLVANAGISGWTASANAQDVYRTKATVVKSSTSPSGTSVAGGAAEVFKFDVTAHASRRAVVNAVAFTLSGTGDGSLTATTDANLYDSTDLSTALETQAYNTATFSDDGDIASGTSSFEIAADATTLNGVPVGSNIVIYDDSAASYNHRLLTGITNAGDDDDATTVAVFSGTAITIAASDTLTYYPMATGTGKLYFGAIAELTANQDLDDATNPVVAVDDEAGFAAGDVVSFAYVGTDDVLTTVDCAAGSALIAVGATAAATNGAVTTADSADNNLYTPNVACSASTVTIDFDYLYTSVGPTYEALTNKFWGRAIVYTGLLNSNAGDEVSAGTTNTYVLKGGTTGLGTNDTLRVDIAATADFEWDDTSIYHITTDTKDISGSTIGGTLIY